MELQEIGCEGKDWIEVAQDMWSVHVKAVMNFRFPLSAGNFLTI